MKKSLLAHLCLPGICWGACRLGCWSQRDAAGGPIHPAINVGLSLKKNATSFWDISMSSFWKQWEKWNSGIGWISWNMRCPLNAPCRRHLLEIPGMWPMRTHRVQRISWLLWLLNLVLAPCSTHTQNPTPCLCWNGQTSLLDLSP